MILLRNGLKTILLKPRVVKTLVVNWLHKVQQTYLQVSTTSGMIVMVIYLELVQSTMTMRLGTNKNLPQETILDENMS